MTTNASAAPGAARSGQPPIWRYILAGLAASLVSIGFARFAFTPLIPEIIKAHWFSPGSVIMLSAANLAGYVAGALVGRPLAGRFGNVRVLRAMMVLITAAFVACAFPLSVSWYFGWRFLSGLGGGTVMVLVAATILPYVPSARRGTASGALFLGLGLGIAGSGTLIPLLLNLGLTQTWIGLALVSGILTAASWLAWPPAGVSANAAAAPSAAGHRFDGTVKTFYIQYAIMLMSLIPPMMFLVDYIARGLHQGTRLGSLFWVLYGVGAIAGPPLYGWLADRLTPRRAVALVTGVQAVVLAIVYAFDNLALLAVVTIVIGTFAPGIVPLALARVHELVPGEAARQNVAWSRTTIISAGAMAAAGYAFSALFNATGGNHRLMFLAAATLLAIVVAVDVIPRRHATRIAPTLPCRA